MTIGEAIEQLSKLDPTLHLMGYSRDESVCLLSEIGKVEVANQWLHTLPVGEKYVQLWFDGAIHIEGEKKVQYPTPKPPQIPKLYKCRYCDYQELLVSGSHCKKCHWMPMMKLVEGTEDVRDDKT